MAKVDMSDSNSILTNILIIIVVIAIAYLIYYVYSAKNNKPSNVPSSESTMPRRMVTNENFEDPEPRFKNVKGKITGDATGLENPVMNKKNMNPNGHITGSNKMEHFSNDGQYKQERNSSSFPKDQLTADELLPQDNSSLWAQVNPSGVGSLKDRSFLQAGYNIGINTVGQTLRNANLQLRSEPPCPQIVISPFLQSTITPDVSRKPFEIGGCA
jgi:hypothetical protein